MLVTAGRCGVTLLCNMLYKNPHAQLLLPAGPAPAKGSTVAARSGGCQFAGIRFLHLQLHLLVCSTRQPWRVLHALGGPRRAAGSAEWPIARLPPACRSAALEEGLQARQQIRIRIQGCTVSWLRRRCADSARQAVIRTWLEDACTNKES